MAFDTDHQHGERSTARAWPSTASLTAAVMFITLIAVVAFRYSATAADKGGYTIAGSPEQAQHTAGQKRCEFFVLQKILSAREPVVLDHWGINGKRVFRMGFSMTAGGGQTERLCVYDPENRSALLPAPGDQDQWLPGPPVATNG